MERFWCLQGSPSPGAGFSQQRQEVLGVGLLAQQQGGAHLLAVLAHIGEDLRERAHGVELIHVHPGLLGQVCIHVLVADGRHLPDV